MDTKPIPHPLPLTRDDSPEPAIRRWLERPVGLALVIGAVFVAVSTATRVALLLKSAHDVAWDDSLAAAFAWGALYDLATACWVMMPWIAASMLLPKLSLRAARWIGGIVQWLTIAALLFVSAAEWFFWDEFGARFNFIAVDYLIYTQEVTDNIRESYPLPWVLAGIALATALVQWAITRALCPRATERRASFRVRFKEGAIALGIAAAVGCTVDSDWLPPFANQYDRELAKNGVWSFVAAFRDNELDYDQFYSTMPPEQAFARLRHELTEDGSTLLEPDQLDTLRIVNNRGVELRPNIIQITVESLSADFLGTFNHESKLTPNLDALAAKSLVFTNLYATGTRTDRGMEALALSLPPTPGRSLIKRPRNEDLFTLGSVLRAKGYDTAFIYGGYGYFDNMNYFFGHNGYRVIDRASAGPEDVTFANAWGACDEDLLRWTMREADARHAAREPFHFFVMTTSNHRPYTYPDGRIDLPSKTSGRAGAVKYTDYAIGKFLSDAASKPWFTDTVFVIVADHCASSAGKTEVPVKNYHIPLLIYSPGGHVAPGRIDVLASQMDYAPTLLGLLHWTYPSRFFGHDVRRVEPSEAHALIGNYQALGHLENNEFVLLQPRHRESTYHFDPATMSLTPDRDSAYAEEEAISFYASASYMYRQGSYRALTAEEFARYTTLGRTRTATDAGADAAR